MIGVLVAPEQMGQTESGSRKGKSPHDVGRAGPSPLATVSQPKSSHLSLELDSSDSLQTWKKVLISSMGRLQATSAMQPIEMPLHWEDPHSQDNAPELGLRVLVRFSQSIIPWLTVDRAHRIHRDRCASLYQVSLLFSKVHPRVFLPFLQPQLSQNKLWTWSIFLFEGMPEDINLLGGTTGY